MHLINKTGQKWLRTIQSLGHKVYTYAKNVTKKVDDGVTCTGCTLLFCISCAKNKSNIVQLNDDRGNG